MSIWGDRLSYISRTVSISVIARELETTPYFVNKYISGEREIEESEQSMTMSLYQRTVARNLFNAGAPANQAALYNSLEPVQAVDKENWIRKIARNLTVSALSEMAYQEGLSDKLTQSYIDSNYDDLYSVIVSKLQTSEKPLSEWSDYPV